jgi:DivIVA domain-containing protein
MALTPEDVVNKRFQPTKFREGYDQDEVDDFLDEVVVELRRLNQENEELRQRLIASDSRINELQRSAGGSAQSAAATPSFVSEPVNAEPVKAEPEPVKSEPVVQQAAPVAAAEPVVVPAPVAAPTPAFGAPAATDPSVADTNNTNNLLQLARRLHEEHVREGVEKRDALIAEGQEEANRVLADAETVQREKAQEAEAALRAKTQEAEAALRVQAQEAENAQRAKLAALEAERTQLEDERVQLESRVEELRNFEREYRLKLKGYIEGQLRELDATNSVASTSDEASSDAASGPSYGAPAATPNAAPNYTGFAGTN